MLSFHRWLALALLATFVLAAAGVAQPPGQKVGFPKKTFGQPTRLGVDDIVERIMTFDRNKDGKVSKDELPERLHHLIAQGDTNRDGALDRDEIRKLATRAETEEPVGRGFGTKIREKGGVLVGPGPGFPGPGTGHMAGVVDDLKLSGKKKNQALAAVKAHEENVRKLLDKARADLLQQMKEILSREELNDFKAALDRPRGATFFSVGPPDTRKKFARPKK